MKLTAMALPVILSVGCSSMPKIDSQDSAWLLMHAIDIGHTVTISRNTIAPHKTCYLTEKNIFTRNIIGRNPKTSDVYKWGIGLAVARFGIYKALDHFKIQTKWLKRIENVVKLNVIYSNEQNGTKAWDTNYNNCN